MANRYKTIVRPSNPKFTKLLSCSQHNCKTPKTCYSSQSEIGGEKGGWVDNSISNQSPNKFYQANRSVK